MKAKEYDLISKCIEDGACYGVRRAFKHTDRPEQDHIIEQVRNAVMGEICEWFEFNEPQESAAG